MNNINFSLKKPWFTTWWVWVLCSIILIIVVPIVISILYLSGLTLSSPNTAFTASDLLMFLGSLLSFFGTVLLGALTVWQNRRIQEIQERNDTISLSCMIQVNHRSASNQTAVDLDNSEYTYDTSASLMLTVSNQGEILLNDIAIVFGNDTYMASLSLAKNAEKKILVPIPDDYSVPICSIEFSSCYGVKSYGEIHMRTFGAHDAEFIPNREARVRSYRFYGINNHRQSS